MLACVCGLVTVPFAYCVPAPFVAKVKATRERRLDRNDEDPETLLPERLFQEPKHTTISREG